MDKQTSINSNSNKKSNKSMYNNKNNNYIPKQCVVHRTEHIPAKRVSEFIGTRGSCISLLTAKTGTIIHVCTKEQNGNEFIPVNIQGPILAVKNAVAMMDKFLQLKPSYRNWVLVLEQEQEQQYQQQNKERQHVTTFSKPGTETTMYENHHDEYNHNDNEQLMLLQFLQAHADCFKKYSPQQIHSCLLEEDIVTIKDLVDALNMDEYKAPQVLTQTIKKFKRIIFHKAAKHACKHPNSHLSESKNKHHMKQQSSTNDATFYGHNLPGKRLSDVDNNQCYERAKKFRGRRGYLIECHGWVWDSSPSDRPRFPDQDCRRWSTTTLDERCTASDGRK